MAFTRSLRARRSFSHSRISQTRQRVDAMLFSSAFATRGFSACINRISRSYARELKDARRLSFALWNRIFFEYIYKTLSWTIRHTENRSSNNGKNDYIYYALQQQFLFAEVLVLAQGHHCLVGGRGGERVVLFLTLFCPRQENMLILFCP